MAMAPRGGALDTLSILLCVMGIRYKGYKMEVIELRYGKEDGYKVQFINELPKDKIIIALHSERGIAFLVTKTNSYKTNKGINIVPITQFEETNKLTEYTAEETLLQDSGFKVYALDTLDDFKKIKGAWYYD